jgi:hypothetical protein
MVAAKRWFRPKIYYFINDFSKRMAQSVKPVWHIQTL